MRRVKVRVPARSGPEVIKLAFSVGLRSVEAQTVTSYESNGNEIKSAVVDIETSAPVAKRFIDELVASEFFDRRTCSVISRDARSILGSDRLADLTVPLVVPATDVLEEQWKFSQITYGFIGRAFLASCLLAYGMITSQLLLMIAGLLFLPLLPLLFSISFGLVTRQRSLSFQGLAALAVMVATLFAGGLFVGLLSSPPVEYSSSNSLAVSLLISLCVGVAAGLASIDDVGRRELIGLAASSQVALVPVLLGIYLIFGPPTPGGWNEVERHMLSFVINILTILVVTAIIYASVYRAMPRLTDS